MSLLAGECLVPIQCIEPKSEYAITGQPVVDWWLAAIIILGLIILAFALGFLRRRV